MKKTLTPAQNAYYGLHPSYSVPLNIPSTTQILTSHEWKSFLKKAHFKSYKLFLLWKKTYFFILL